jgi:hypothetical protein
MLLSDKMQTNTSNLNSLPAEFMQWELPALNLAQFIRG